MTTLLRDEPLVRMLPPARRGVVAWHVGVWIAGFLLYSLTIRRLGTFTGLRTGAAPLYAWWRAGSTWRHPLGLALLLLPITLFFACRWVVHRWERRRLGEISMLGLAVLFTFAFDIAICLLDFDHTHSLWDRIGSRFNWPGVQFYGDVHYVHSVRQFLHDYVALHQQYIMSVHANTHPPGSVLFFYAIQKLFGVGLIRAGLVACGIAALGLVPAYLIARRLYGRRIAAFAACLLAVTPSFILWGYTSTDAVYVLPMLTCVWLFIEITRAESWRRWLPLAVALGLLMAVCALLTFATCCLGMLMGCYALIAGWKSGRWRRDGAALAFAAGVFVACYVILYWQTGYHLLECAKVSMTTDEAYMGKRGGRLGSYLDYSFADLAAYLISLGFLATMLLARRTVGVARSLLAGRNTDPFVLSLATTLLMMSFSTLFRLETERIWIFLTPLAILPAARWVSEQPPGTEPGIGLRRLDFALGAQFIQLLVMQCCLFTNW